MLERSLGGARARFLDGDAVKQSLAERAAALSAADTNVAAVFLFGSLAKGNYGPESDADLLIVEREPSAERQMDRPLRYSDAFSRLAVPVDLIVLTLQEVAAMRSERRLFIREAIDEAIALAGAAEECGVAAPTERVTHGEV